jgi:REP element-mobilizing transposase RayT
MGQLLRIEDPERVSHITSRTRRSRLWFINNRQLELKTLTYAARLQEKYNVTLYALCLMGNHFHQLARFPRANRAAFERDFKCQYQRYAKSCYPELDGEQLWGQRYSEQAVLLDSDIEIYFWYVMLQPIRAGLCDHLKDSPVFSCFQAAISGQDVELRYFHASEYARAKLHNPHVRKQDFVEKHTLKFARLPGYEHLSQKEYKELMLKKYAVKRLEAIQLRFEEKGIKHSAPQGVLKQMKPGAFPKTTKKSTRWSKRPVALSASAEAKKSHLADYFDKWRAHRAASIRYRNGDHTAVFPPGTFKPPLLVPPR